MKRETRVGIRVRLLAAVCAFVIVVAGCSEAPESQGEAPSPDRERVSSADISPTEPYPFSTPAPPVEATPIDGLYTRSVTVEQIGQEPTYCRRCAPYRLDAGEYTLRFENGRYFVHLEPSATERKCKKCHLPPDFASSGHFTIEGDEIVLFNDTNCSRMTGRYRWTVEDDTLTFEEVDDDCPYSELRPRFLTTYPWTVE